MTEEFQIADSTRQISGVLKYLLLPPFFFLDENQFPVSSSRFSVFYPHSFFMASISWNNWVRSTTSTKGLPWVLLLTT